MAEDISQKSFRKTPEQNPRYFQGDLEAFGVKKSFVDKKLLKMNESLK